MADQSDDYVGVIHDITHNRSRGGDLQDNVRAFLKDGLKWVALIALGIVAIGAVSIMLAKQYEASDDLPSRGAIAVSSGVFGESYAAPMYIQQGWSPADSLWYYNTTQGSALLPYDFFLALELPDSKTLLRSDAVMDRYRYLPQGPSKFNLDSLPVGFVREPYKGRDYVGYTCAACHTGQINFGGQAIRIDGGPAMADMDEFLALLERSMTATLNDETKFRASHRLSSVCATTTAHLTASAVTSSSGPRRPASTTPSTT